jgi:tetratricopeptide (TPR) repeat protein
MTRLEDAFHLHRDGRQQEAIAALREILADADPQESGHAALLLGLLLERGADLQGAAGAYRRGVELGDNDVGPACGFALGVLSEARGDVGAARAAYTSVLESGNRQAGPRAGFNLALIEHRAGNLAAAIVAYQAVLAFGDPEETPKAARNLGGLLYQAGDLNGAAAAYQMVIDAGPSQHLPAAAFGLAGVLHASGESDGALIAYAMAADSGDEQIAPHAAMPLAIMAQRRGDTQEATRRYRQAAASGDPQLRADALTALAELEAIPSPAATEAQAPETGSSARRAPRPPDTAGAYVSTRPARSASRTIRVFVSSTFADMQQERDELVKHVFPKLRELCESRGVVWGEVDLRWGITDEQRDEGLVLPICLQEIRECRPYFIGLLGERYGFVPQLDAALIEVEPWLAGHRGKSVTELEIIHGVLADPAMTDHAFFYFRDPAHLPQATVSEEAPGDREKLAALKARIRESGLPVRENYPSPRELGRLILEDFTRLIDRLFPPGSEPTPLQRERSLHESFRRTRADVYIGRPGDFTRLDDHAAGAAAPLVVLGESGIGKSALLANWAQRLEESSEQALLGGDADAPFLVTHFVAASPASADWATMVGRIVAELSNHFELGIEPGNSVPALQASLADALHRSAARGRVVLIIDGLDRLEDHDGAADLVWLPPVIPPQVRLIVSTLPGRARDELARRDWPTFEVAALDGGERQRLIHDYLAQYRKTLPDDLEGRIASAPQSSSPLFLRTLLEELRIYGDHDSLTRRINELLSAPDIPWLYGLILDRWQRDYERDRPALVRDALTLLSAARFGLTERELLDMLGTGGNPLPQASWSPLYLAAKPVLSNRNGLLGFAHDYVRSAVQQRFFSTEQSRRAAHSRLAAYFWPRPSIGKRGLDELPWQLASAEDWERLVKLLGAPEILQALAITARFDLCRYWARTEAASPLRMVDAYRSLLDNTDLAADTGAILSELLRGAGYLDEALALDRRLAERYRATGEPEALAAVLDRQAGVLRVRGDQDAALAVADEQQRLCQELDDRDGVQRAMGTRAQIMRDHGDPAGALELLHEQEQLCRELGNDVGLGACLADQAICGRRRGDLDGALALSQESERIGRRLGDEGGMMRSLGLQAAIRFDQGDMDGALALHQRVEELARGLGDRPLLQSSIQHQAAVHLARENLDIAQDLYAQAEEICRELGIPTSLTAILPNQAEIALKRGDLDGAMGILDENDALCRELNIPDGLAACLHGKARVLERRGDLDGAIAKLKEQESIWRDLGRRRYLQVCLGEQARLLEQRGDLDAAEAVLREDETLCRELDAQDGLQRCFAIQARVLQGRGDLDGAIAKLAESERICRDIGELGDLADSLRRHAGLLADTGDRRQAGEMGVEAAATLRLLGEFDEALQLLGQLSVILRESGDIDAALRVQDERGAILRERGDVEGCADSMTGRAILLRDRGDIGAAIAALEEAERILREADRTEKLVSALGVHAVILKDRGDTDAALALIEECASIARAGSDRATLLMILDERVRIVRSKGDSQATLAAIAEREAVFREVAKEPQGVQAQHP